MARRKKIVELAYTSPKLNGYFCVMSRGWVALFALLLGWDGVEGVPYGVSHDTIDPLDPK